MDLVKASNVDRLKKSGGKTDDFSHGVGAYIVAREQLASNAGSTIELRSIPIQVNRGKRVGLFSEAASAYYGCCQ